MAARARIIRERHTRREKLVATQAGQANV